MSDPRTDPRGSPDALQRALAELNISSDDKRASAEKKIGDAVYCFWWFENGASCAPTQREMKERAARVHAALGVILENVTPENLYFSVALFRNSHRYRRERRDDFLKRLKQLREELDVLSVAADPTIYRLHGRTSRRSIKGIICGPFRPLGSQLKRA